MLYELELRPDETSLLERLRGELEDAKVPKPWDPRTGWDHGDVLRYGLRVLGLWVLQQQRASGVWG